MVPISEPAPTVYRSQITTPSGIDVLAEVVVPPDAEYADQHELVEAVAVATTRIVVGLDRQRRCGAMTPGPTGRWVGPCEVIGAHSQHVDATGATWEHVF